mmetsp:Transcript_4816/g.8320  ORF Transcript_4816/g.8320 Transcript_4816/m.8320 type:complete len:851 (+) Transcript_4816:64-2616(+)
MIPLSQAFADKKLVLQTAAQVIVGSLVDDAPLSLGKELQQLREILLAEVPDAGEEALMRCKKLRQGLADAVRAELRKRPKAAPVVQGSEVLPVRLEVRQTAGRTMQAPAFVIGRAPENDVQMSGDPTVSRLQLLAISLPGGIIIADAWSSGGTRVVHRSSSSKLFPSSVPNQRSAFILPHGERITMLVGAKTTITIGPILDDGNESLSSQAAAASAAAATVAAAVMAAEVKAAPPAVPSQPSQPAKLQQAPPRTEVPVAEAAVAKVPVATPQQPRPSVVAAPQQQEIATAAAEAAHPNAPRTSASQQLRLCLLVVKAQARIRQVHITREQLRWRCDFARRMLLITEMQHADLRQRVSSDEDAEEVQDVLDGLGVPAALDERLPATSSSGVRSSWQCPLCRCSQRSRGWQCPFQHRYCRKCLIGWLGEQPFPKCPQEGCGYQLGRMDMEDLRVPDMPATQADAGTSGPSVLGRPAKSEQLVRCPGRNCGACVVVSQDGPARQRRFDCVCGAPSMCLGCGVGPFHYHGACAEVQTLRSRWRMWLAGGREVYISLQRKAAREATAQQRALREASARLQPVAPDEHWKERNCRLCPRCRRAVQKPDGDSMAVCGKSGAAGTRQAGCGFKFKWQTAHPYRILAGATLKRLAVGKPRLGRGISRSSLVSGRGVRHIFRECKLCGDGSGKCIVGPCFRCIHCPAFECCLKCEPRLVTEHQEDHVFEIMFDDGLNWGRTGVPLPKGVRARLRRFLKTIAVPCGGAGGASVPPEEDNEAAANGDSQAVRGQRVDKRPRDVEGGAEGVLRGQKKGKYMVELTGGRGTRLVAPEDLQPLLTPKQAERMLASSPDGLEGCRT